MRRDDDVDDGGCGAELFVQSWTTVKRIIQFKWQSVLSTSFSEKGEEEGVPQRAFVVWSVGGYSSQARKIERGQPTASNLGGGENRVSRPSALLLTTANSYYYYHHHHHYITKE